MFPDSYKNFDFDSVGNPLHRMILQALLQTGLRPCEIRDRLELKDSSIIYRIGWKHLGRNFFNERTSFMQRKAQAEALGELAAKAAAAKASPSPRPLPAPSSDSDPVQIVPAPRPARAAEEERPSLAANGPAAGPTLQDIVAGRSHTPWFEEHVPKARRADLRQWMPWLQACRAKEPSSPSALLAVELFLFTDLASWEVRSLGLSGRAVAFKPALQECFGIASGKSAVDKRSERIAALWRHAANGGAAPAAPHAPAAAGTLAMSATARMPAMPGMARAPAMAAMGGTLRTPAAAPEPGFRLRFRRGGVEIEYEGEALGAAEIEAFMKAAMGGAA